MPPKPSFDLNDTGNRIILAIVIALIFLGGWWLIARNSGGSPLGTTGEKTEEVKATGTAEQVKSGSLLGPVAKDAPTIAGSSESLEVEDQPAGMSVNVKAATFARMGWIAIRDEDGKTLGAGRFEEGTHANGEVPLLRATESGKRYQVLIYVDDGDRSFDLHKDILVTRSDGSVAGVMFTVR